MIRLSHQIHFKNISKKFMSTRNFNIFTSIGVPTNKSSKNIKHLESITLTINNPETIEWQKNWWRGWWNYIYIFEVTLNLKKDGVLLTKNFQSNNFIEITKEINNFMEDPIEI